MIVRPLTYWTVTFRNCHGIMRQERYWTQHHAEQFARAISPKQYECSEIKVNKVTDEANAY
jgi:hypothetical protein